MKACMSAEGDCLKSHPVEFLVFVLVLLCLSAGTYWRNRIWNDPVLLWKDCVVKSPNKARVHANLGSAFLGAGAYDKALEAAEEAIRINPRYAEAYYYLSLVHQKRGELDRGIAAAKQSLALDSELYMAYYTLGTIYFEKEQYPEAAEAFEQFLGVYPAFPETHHLLAVVYTAQKKFDRAVAEFERELRINPYHVLSHLNLGQIYWFEMKNRQKSILHLRTALRLDPFLPNRGEIRRLVESLERTS
jgi:tetratricopeptide (TPR) repeat protein